MRSVSIVVVAALLSCEGRAFAALRAELVAEGFVGVIAIVPDPVLGDTVYIAQADGLVATVRGGQRLATPFLDLRGAVTAPGGEQGLLGMAFPKDAASSDRVFVNFTNGVGHTVIARFRRTSGDPRVADPASRADLQWPAPGGGRRGYIEQPSFNHNGGHLAFGPDGFLYIALGDGGGDNDPGGHAQSPTSLLGKILRVNVSVPDADPIGYAVPPGIPTFPIPGVLPEIWAFGLRNPWRYSFDDLGLDATNALILADVGQDAREEIDVELPGHGGRNYGWRAFEGRIPNPNIPPEPLAFDPHTPPVYDITRAQGRSITGGYVYRGRTLPATLVGRYFYGDCIYGTISSIGLDIDESTGLVTARDPVDHIAELGGHFRCVTTFARDRRGELYFADVDIYKNGESRVFRLVDGDQLPPAPPTGLTAAVVGTAVTISWTPPPFGGTVSGYLVEGGTRPGATDLGAMPSTATTVSVPGVPNGTYSVRVRSVGPKGVSAPTADVPVVVGCSAQPAVPSTFTASAVNGIAMLGWDLPTGTTRTLIEAGFMTGGLDVVFAVDAPESTFSTPAPPGTYFVRARAGNACGLSGPTQEQILIVP